MYRYVIKCWVDGQPDGRTRTNQNCVAFDRKKESKTKLRDDVFSYIFEFSRHTSALRQQSITQTYMNLMCDCFMHEQ